MNWPDTVCYPEVPVPLPEGLDGSGSGTGFWVPLVASVKKAVSIPVIATGGIHTELAEKILRQGKQRLAVQAGHGHLIHGRGHYKRVGFALRLACKLCHHKAS